MVNVPHLKPLVSFLLPRQNICKKIHRWFRWIYTTLGIHLKIDWSLSETRQKYKFQSHRYVTKRLNAGHNSYWFILYFRGHYCMFPIKNGGLGVKNRVTLYRLIYIPSIHEEYLFHKYGNSWVHLVHQQLQFWLKNQNQQVFLQFPFGT